jgi:uncharacterized protein YutE (UPF0331/DUF86 family)
MSSRVEARSPTIKPEGRDALELVSFNLILAIQAALDVASHLIADEGWPAAATLAESFVRLHERKVISAQTLAGIRPAARLAHLEAHRFGGRTSTFLTPGVGARAET